MVTPRLPKPTRRLPRVKIAGLWPGARCAIMWLLAATGSERQPGDPTHHACGLSHASAPENGRRSQPQAGGGATLPGGGRGLSQWVPAGYIHTVPHIRSGVIRINREKNIYFISIFIFLICAKILPKFSPKRPASPAWASSKIPLRLRPFILSSTGEFIITLLSRTLSSVPDTLGRHLSLPTDERP